MKHSPPLIAVVGAGFSGVMTALHLLRRPDPVKVVLIERRHPIGQGAAYATDDPAHRLNVRAGNMSAWPDKPDDFVEWLAAKRLDVGPGGFATRGDYGSYLQSLLAAMAEGPRAVGRLLVTPDEITAIERDGDGWVLTCGMGRTIAADAVVLAVGNPPPFPPAPIDDHFAASANYVADPWRWDPCSPPGDGPILLLGSGLTMVDAALSLDRAAPGRRLIALSRRGLIPREHMGVAPSPLPPPPPSTLSPVEVLTWLRRAAKQHGWRTAIDAARPATQGLWRHWNLRRRRAFLRHGRAFWDVHRHRLSPQVARRVAAMIDEGRLQVLTGKLETATSLADGRAVIGWRPRGALRSEQLTASLVINCTGPSSDVERSTEPLVAALAERGHIRADPLRLGLDTDALHRAIDSGGRVHANLFAVGPITRGALWEINAVPDIRLQAMQVADAVLEAVRRR